MNTNLIEKNFESLYLAANAAQYQQGLSWYDDAHKIAVRIQENFPTVTLSQVCGVISALSPNNKWERNIVDTEALIQAFVLGLGIDDVKVCTYTPNKIKAWDILNGKDVESVITANKTLNFYLNIFNPLEEYVTIDNHQINAGLYGFQRMAIASNKLKLTDTTYYLLADVVANLSGKYNIRANQMQAIIWTVYRDLVIERK